MRNTQGTNTDGAGDRNSAEAGTVGSGVNAPDDGGLGGAHFGAEAEESTTPEADTDKKRWARFEKRASELLGLLGVVVETVQDVRERRQGGVQSEAATPAPEETPQETAAEEGQVEGAEAQETEPSSESEETTESSIEREAKERLVNKLREIGLTVGVESLRFIDAALEKIAKDPAPSENPTLRETVTDKIVSLIPVVGISKQIADARMIAKTAKEIGDDALMHRAKTKCLIALYEGNIDLLTLGAGSLLAKSTKLSSAILRVLVGAKASTQMPYFEEFAGALAKEVLQSSTMNGIVETILARPPEKEEGSADS